MITCTGATCIIRLLERQGIRLVTGIPGGANLPLYDALRESSIQHVLARHEQGAGFMAQGMARSTGKPAVFFATSGPGATNTITALADARLDSIPVICITGQVPLGLIGTDAFQEVDTYGLSIPVTKHNFLVRDPTELLEVIPEAFRIAASGRPGPVLIDVPKDVQCMELSFEAWPEPGMPAPPQVPEPEDLDAAAALIDAAQRPLLYVGGGVIQSGAGNLVRHLAEKASMPVVMSLMGLGAIPARHPLALGMLGMHGARCTNLVVEESDLIVAAGVRFDDRATGKVEQFCPNARIVHIDIDPGELHKIKRAHVAVTSDVGLALEGLMQRVKPRKRSGWLALTAALRAQHPLAMPGLDDPRSPYGLIRAVAEHLPPDAIVATDVGQHQMWTAQAYPHRRPRQWLTSGGLGTMGFGMPTAIGAALANPGRTVVCFSGDGSLMMNIQELATAVEQQVNVKIILCNNNSLGLVRQQQDLFYGRRYVASSFAHHVDFPTIATGFGMPSVDLGTCTDPRAALAKCLRTPGPCLVHAPFDADARVFPMVPPGAANCEMIGGTADACSTS
jgi:acetolactate synthase I/II/III large subunit